MVDATSDKVVLYYTGNDAGVPAISGVPARDLTENDIARIVAVEHLNDEEPLTDKGHEKAADELMDRLADGPYRKTAPDKASHSHIAPQQEARLAAEAEAAKTAKSTKKEAPAEPSATSAEGAEA